MPAAKSELRKKRYEVGNWSEYNEALVNHGDFTFWFSEEVVDAWEHENEAKKNGRPFTYSDLAVETLLTSASCSVCRTGRPRASVRRSRS